MSDRNEIIKELLRELQMKMKSMMVKGLGSGLGEDDPMNPKEMSNGEVVLDPEAAEAEGMDQLPESLESTDQPKDDSVIAEVKEEMVPDEKEDLKSGLESFLKGKPKAKPEDDGVTVSLMGMKQPKSMPKKGMPFKKKSKNY